MSKYEWDNHKDTNFSEFERFFRDSNIQPIYDTRSDYTTNAPSFYEYLSRHNHLIKILAQRIYDYDKELAKRFEEWDKRIESFPKDVENLLIEWLSDGTLDKVINENIFNMKLDTVIFEDFKQEIENLIQLNEKSTNEIYYNIKKSGAIGNGYTDDTQAFKHAVELCCEKGYTLFIPNGRYIISDIINVECDTFTLKSNHAEVFMISETVKRGFLEIKSKDVLIENVRFNGNNKSIKGILITENNNAILNNVHIENLHGDSSYQGNGTAIVGIGVQSQNGTVYIDNCSVKNLSRKIFKHNESNYYIEAISVTKGKRVKISNNIIENIKHDITDKIDADGIKVFTSILSDNTYDKALIVISDNMIKNCSGRFIKTQSNYHTVIERNYFVNNDGLELIQNHHGIDIQTGVAIVKNNYFHYLDFTGGGSGDLIFLNSPRNASHLFNGYMINVKDNIFTFKKPFKKVIGMNLDPYVDKEVTYKIIGNEVISDGVNVNYFISANKKTNKNISLFIEENAISTYDFLELKQLDDVLDVDLTNIFNLFIKNNIKVGTLRTILYPVTEKINTSSIVISGNENMNFWTGKFDMLKLPQNNNFSVQGTFIAENVKNSPTNSNISLTSTLYTVDVNTTNGIYRVLKANGNVYSTLLTLQ